jgi:GTP cyclohydrolase II
VPVEKDKKLNRKAGANCLSPTPREHIARVTGDLRIAAQFDAIRLLKNNPAKVETFKANGIIITEQLPLRVARNVHNQDYLAVKALKSGHLL